LSEIDFACDITALLKNQSSRRFPAALKGWCKKGRDRFTGFTPNALARLANFLVMNPGHWHHWRDVEIYVVFGFLAQRISCCSERDGREDETVAQPITHF
jgi:hypothetical protein